MFMWSLRPVTSVWDLWERVGFVVLPGRPSSGLEEDLFWVAVQELNLN